MDEQCKAMARAAAKDALSRHATVPNDEHGIEYKVYWSSMVLGERKILAYCDADLVHLVPLDGREDWLTEEFMGFAEGLHQVVEDDRNA